MVYNHSGEYHHRKKEQGAYILGYSKSVGKIDTSEI